MDVIINSRNCRQRQYLFGKINDIDEFFSESFKKRNSGKLE